MIRKAQVEGGTVVGIPAADPRITAFKGIPFAAPPVGENRWRAPQPVIPWEGEKECFKFAPISMQHIPGLDKNNIYSREWNVDPEIEMDEDCLYLNVWTPANSVDEKLPVFVWFFGGGLQEGYPPEMEFDGERIARRGIVVVSVNYRLNSFGFLAHPEITAENRPRLWRTYANQVHHLDMAAGRLIRALENKKMLDNSLVIFISDHGESLFDDGYLLGHGIAIQDTMTHAVMTIWGAHHDIPSQITHTDIRKFIHDDFAAVPKKPQIIHGSLPVLQFIGATTVPSAISHRFEDGSRITNSAWKISKNPNEINAKQIMNMPQHGDVPVETLINRTASLKPTGLYISPISDPLNDPQIQTLIREWEYIQWSHRD